MVESFPGRNSQQIRSFLPPCRGGGSLSRFTFSLSPYFFNTFYSVISASFSHTNAKHIAITASVTAVFTHWFSSSHLNCGLIRKPNLICEQNTVGLSRSVSETNCKVPLWEDKKQ
ncbi:hypothetical protein Dd1591_1592 [Dickeya chrysanthemi Ech1591]|uniref:Uncharacterized protein n=1 Tax=Dickeya chrysanthemi (strain Ech1591) TaxID=561229 RepID=C6CF95_DICC1|nr:hypothetical protein Dd1591_1592 [Dickeya chrysanthemi Ech1591]